MIDLLAQAAYLAGLLALGGQGGRLALSASGPGELHPAAQRPGGHAQVACHAADRASAAHQSNGVLLELAVVTPRSLTFFVHVLCPSSHSPVRKIKEGSDGEEELRSFYRGIGHCLALMRLLGGCDLHAENVIAYGGMPVVIDCETLFAPRIPPAPSRYGNALDRACEPLSHTVLSVGLLPGRGAGLGWRGVDVSAVGMLPGEQPTQMQPGILRAGTDEASVGLVPVGAPRSQNHPSPEPALAEHWPEVLRGFDELTDALHNLDAPRALHPRLRVFEKCGVRVVPRSTET